MSILWVIAAGLLAIVAMLDRVSSKRGRIFFLSQVRRLASNRRELWLKRRFDQVLGKKLLSWRAFLVTSAVVALVWCLSAAFPLVTTPFDFIHSIAVNFTNGPTAIAFTLACIVMLITSYYSLCQTRLFLDLLQGSQAPFLIATVLLADFFAGIAIFMVGFAIARLICVFTVLAFFVSDPIVDTARYSPLALVTATDVAGISARELRAQSGDDAYRARGYADLIEVSRSFSRNVSQADLDRVAQAFRAAEFGIPDRRYSRLISFHASLECVSTFVDLRDGGYKYLETSTNSLGVVAQIGSRFPDLLHNLNAFRDLRRTDYQRSVESSDASCPIPLIVLERRVSMHDYIASSSLGSFFLASLLFTGRDTFQEVAYKFSPYIGTNATEDLDDFLGHAAAIQASSVLGTNRENDFLISFAQFASEPGQELWYRGPIISLPLSLFMAGAVFTSLLLWLYAVAVTLRTSVGLVRRVVANSLFYVDLRRNPVTIFVLVAYGLIAALWLAMDLAKALLLLLF